MSSTVPQLIATIDATQDGRPLHKFLEGSDIRWERFTDPEFMSPSDVLNLLLVKIAESDSRADDIEYVIRQLQMARSTIEHFGNEGPITNVTPRREWKPLENVVQASGLCPVCGGPDHDFDCR